MPCNPTVVWRVRHWSLGIYIFMGAEYNPWVCPAPPSVSVWCLLCLVRGIDMLRIAMVHSGQICRNVQRSASTLQQPKMGPIFRRCGRVGPWGLGLPPWLRKPAILPHTPSTLACAGATGRATLIAPYWPAQPWTTTLLSMLVDSPIKLPNSPRLLVSSAGCLEPRRNRRWNIFAWGISGARS